MESVQESLAEAEDIPFENCTLAKALADEMRSNREELTHRWLGRISARVTLDPNRIFPTDALLDHVPLLILGIADYIENPGRVILSEVPVVAKAMELGELRFSQGFDEYEVLKEYEIFGGILFSFLSRVVDDIEEPCSRGELLACAHRLFLAVALIQQATLTHYLSLVKERLNEREQRLRGFNRALSHEMGNLIGTIAGAAEILELGAVSPEQHRIMTSMIVRNSANMKVTLTNLVELSRVDENARQSRHIALPNAAAEVARQLRESARAHGVEIRLADDLPAIDVSAAAFELCLSNLLANAIKYSDPSKDKRWVEVRARVTGSDDAARAETVVEVHDNGLGVPETKRANLFERFFRAHEDSNGAIAGTGLGLSIVRETITSLGGRAWADFRDDGTTFFFTMPNRRAEDDAASESEYPSVAPVAGSSPVNRSAANGGSAPDATPNG
ncbi:MAG TPA: HAMP domain-containing sensor histidine kinase [Gemmatimonadaceae bacterium]|jgi:signal transduction histidine kinase|nr:HAMP domain-containing sensor histidine kinase [Gemmatimonadaceae bacterium]